MDSINKQLLPSIAILALLLVSACDKEDSGSDQTAMDQTPSSNEDNASASSNTSINNRDLYPDLSFIEADTISKNYLNYTLVDVRSNYEYRVLRMADSVSIPSNDRSFEVRLRNLVRKHKQTVVLYGNGGKERNAHDAARIAKRNKIENILVFDGDISAWAENMPQYAELNGKAINDENILIDLITLNDKFLSEEDFTEKFSKDKSALLDIRVDAQSNRYSLQSNAEHIPLDHQSNLIQFLNKVKLENKTLFVYDDHGLQVRWLTYQFKKQGIDNYYFLKEGV